MVIIQGIRWEKERIHVEGGRWRENREKVEDGENTRRRWELLREYREKVVDENRLLGRFAPIFYFNCEH